ncbi:hypothetical protein EVAR_28322_1 [Eumeta japonica]|uniref:Uncharacterized protein n=1 Tax=Eumeta variegata TaxID=151549 RepID=A0A4C1V8L2_EUMVA|nr:hypothetical protein EVAR_28322_1 [Eumeta japonica]
MRTYMRACMPACVRTCLRACLRVFVRSNAGSSGAASRTPTAAQTFLASNERSSRYEIYRQGEILHVVPDLIGIQRDRCFTLDDNPVPRRGRARCRIPMESGERRPRRLTYAAGALEMARSSLT